MPRDTFRTTRHGSLIDLDVNDHPFYAISIQYPESSYYMTGQTSLQGSATSVIAKDIMVLFPFWLAWPADFTTLAVAISSVSVAGLVGLGVYSDNGAVYPDTLLASAVDLDGTTTGLKTGAITLSLRPGLYWLGYNASGTLTLKTAATKPTIRGVTDPNTSAVLANAFSGALSYTGVMPTTVPGAVISNSYTPFVWVK